LIDPPIQLLITTPWSATALTTLYHLPRRTFHYINLHLHSRTHSYYGYLVVEVGGFATSSQDAFSQDINSPNLGLVAMVVVIVYYLSSITLFESSRRIQVYWLIRINCMLSDHSVCHGSTPVSDPADRLRPYPNKGISERIDTAIMQADIGE
jgi:hypothetical protein